MVPAFVELPMPKEVQSVLPPPPVQAPDSISVEIRRGGTTGQADLPPDTRSAACLRKVEGWTRVDAVWLAVQPLDVRLGTRQHWLAWGESAFRPASP